MQIIKEIHSDFVMQEKRSEQNSLENFDNFKELMTQKSSSTGECVVVALNSLFRYIFGSKVNLLFNYNQFEKKRKIL